MNSNVETKTFWVEKLPIVDWVYSALSKGPCPIYGDYHEAESEPIERVEGEEPYGWPHAPKNCACGYLFTSDDYSGRGSPRYKRSDTGEVIFGKLPFGALLIASRQLDNHQSYPRRYGIDGLAIAVVMYDGGWWYPESRASNCTMNNDDTHRCWVRHGTFGEMLHVDKNGHTCQAGAGSIVWRDWHGYLHNGELTLKSKERLNAHQKNT